MNVLQSTRALLHSAILSADNFGQTIRAVGPYCKFSRYDTSQSSYSTIAISEETTRTTGSRQSTKAAFRTCTLAEQEATQIEFDRFADHETFLADSASFESEFVVEEDVTEAPVWSGDRSWRRSNRRLSQIKQHLTPSNKDLTVVVESGTATQAATTMTLIDHGCPFSECQASLDDVICKIEPAASRNFARLACVHIQCGQMYDTHESWRAHITSPHHHVTSVMEWRVEQSKSSLNTSFVDSPERDMLAQAYPPVRCPNCSREAMVDCGRGADGPCTSCTSCGRHYAKVTWRQ